MGKRIVLSTFGSFGDIHPYVALALELKARGHRPVIATSAIYREKTDALGLEHHAVRPDMPSYDQPEEISRLLEDFMHPRTGTENVVSTFVTPYLRESYEDLLEITKDADLLLTHPFPFTGPLVAKKTGVRWISSVLAPASFISAFDPPVLPQWPGLYKLLKLHPSFVRALLWLARRKTAPVIRAVNRLRAELDLPPANAHPLFEGQHSPARVLALFSSALATPQRDWPPQTRVTGFCFYDRRDRPGDTPQAAPELLKFLDDGEPPIIFTLGSTAFWVAKDFYRASIQAAQALDRRALLLIGDARNLPAEPLPEGIAAFEYAPYSEVLPRACAVVHHGGVGSTGQGLRAGRPALVVPFSHDQFDNGARVARHGAGRMLPRPRYNTKSAAAELGKLLSEPSYAAKAEELGRVVRGEDGAKNACDEIERILNE